MRISNWISDVCSSDLLGAQGHVAVSFEQPEYTTDVDALGTLRLLESIRLLGLERKTRFYQAGTSELFGLVQQTPQSEITPFHPRTPFGAAQVFLHWITIPYREAFGMNSCQVRQICGKGMSVTISRDSEGKS